MKLLPVSKRSNSSISKDILFVHVPKLNNRYQPYGEFMFILYQPVGLPGIADLLDKEGYRVAITHMGVECLKYKDIDVKRILERHNPDIVGLDLHWHFQSYDVIEIARKINTINPSIKILIGGMTSSYYAREIMNNFEFIDFVIRGEAEVPILELLKQVQGKQVYDKVPNLTFRENSKVTENPVTYVADKPMLNSLNFTNFSLIDDYEIYRDSLSRFVYTKGVPFMMQKAMIGSKIYPVFLGRGCVQNCSYCGGSRNAHKLISGRNLVSFRTPDAVIKSLEDIQNYGFECVEFNYDPFPAKQSEAFYFSLFDKIVNKNIHLNFHIERWKLPSEKFIKRFRDTLTKNSKIDISLNSYSEDLRKRNNLYYFSNNDLEQCLELLEKHAVKSTLFFSFGLPGETQRDLEEMIKYQKSLSRRFRLMEVNNSMIEIEPGSEISLHPKRYKTNLSRTTFMDYYRYHSSPYTNHYQALGHRRLDGMSEDELNRFRCRYLCPIFKPACAARFSCKAVSFARKCGIFSIADRFLGRLYGNQLKKCHIGNTRKRGRPSSMLH